MRTIDLKTDMAGIMIHNLDASNGPVGGWNVKVWGTDVLVACRSLAKVCRPGVELECYIIGGDETEQFRYVVTGLEK